MPNYCIAMSELAQDTDRRARQAKSLSVQIAVISAIIVVNGGLLPNRGRRS